MMPQAYGFRPMTKGDLQLVRSWLSAPHVAQWWGQPDEQFGIVSGDLEEPSVDQFIVAKGDRSIAYLQCYDPSAWPDTGFGTQPRGTRGIDQFIGEADMIERGHGSAFVRMFVDGLLSAGTPRVITDPEPGNARAIRAYEKAGFRKERLVDTPNGPALLMLRDA